MVWTVGGRVGQLNIPLCLNRSYASSILLSRSNDRRSSYVWITRTLAVIGRPTLKS